MHWRPCQTDSFVRSSLPSFLHSSLRSSVRSFDRSIVRSFVRLPARSIDSWVRGFIDSRISVSFGSWIHGPSRPSVRPVMLVQFATGYNYCNCSCLCFSIELFLSDGLLEYWRKKYWPKPAHCTTDEGPKALDLYQLQGIFYIMIVSILLSWFILLAEVAVSSFVLYINRSVDPACPAVDEDL